MYRSVVSQQGRVTLEADANEAEEIRTTESSDDGSMARSRSVGIAIATVVAIALVSVAALIIVWVGGTGADTDGGTADEVNATGHELGSSTTMQSPTAAATGASTTATTTAAAAVSTTGPSGGVITTMITTTAATTPSTSAATTPAPSDTSPPMMGAVDIKPPAIWEQGSKAGCVSSSSVSASLSDASAIAGVVLSWSVGTVGDSTAMADSGGGVWTATTPGFDPGTVPKGMSKVEIAYTVKATDVHGYSATTTAMSTLYSVDTGC